MWRDQTSQFHPVCRVGSGFPWFCWNAAFMWKQSPGPFGPSVVTEDNEIHNICHFLALFGVTDLLLIRGLPMHVQLRSWNEADGSHGISGSVAGRPAQDRHVSCPSRPQAWDTEAKLSFTRIIITTTFFDESNMNLSLFTCYTHKTVLFLWALWNIFSIFQLVALILQPATLLFWFTVTAVISVIFKRSTDYLFLVKKLW